uniref:Transposase n=1 Tax=Ascaris lumbricoides TaxID=6252 RepID=A0A0M3HYP1_ASCLU
MVSDAHEIDATTMTRRCPDVYRLFNATIHRTPPLASYRRRALARPQASPDWSTASGVSERL